MHPEKISLELFNAILEQGSLVVVNDILHVEVARCLEHKRPKIEDELIVCVVLLLQLRGDVFLLKFGKHILSLSSALFFDALCLVGLTMAWSPIVTTRIELHAASGFD